MGGRVLSPYFPSTIPEPYFLIIHSFSFLPPKITKKKEEKALTEEIYSYFSRLSQLRSPRRRVPGPRAQDLGSGNSKKDGIRGVQAGD
jgi:hypothetical protein